MTSFITWRAGDVEKAIFNLLKQMLPNTKLQDFEKKPNSEIREIKPPRDGIAYVGEYLMEMAMTGIPGMLSSSDKIKIEQYWNKDGNCIGFVFQGQQYMFDKEKLPEHGRDTVAQGFIDGQSRILSKVPENSELAKYLAQYPDAILTPDSKWGWITKLPEGSYPELKITAQRLKVWDKNGRYMSVIKGMQKEM